MYSTRLLTHAALRKEEAQVASARSQQTEAEVPRGFVRNSRAL